MRNRFFLTGLVLMLFLSGASLIARAEEDYATSEEKAERAHRLSQSDVIYQQEDFRALYYQNEAVIRLLKEIREEMHSMNIRSAKEDQKKT